MISMRRVPFATGEGVGACAAVLKISPEALMASSKTYMAQEGIPLRFQLRGSFLQEQGEGFSSMM